MIPVNKNKNDFELFLLAFQKPTQIYKLLSYRHAINPVFLHRNASYMRHRRTKRADAPRRSLETIVRDLNKRAGERSRVKSREGSLKISVTGIDNKANSSKSSEVYDIKVFLHKVSSKSKPQDDRATPIANLKFTTHDKKSSRSPTKMPSVTTIRGSTLNSHSSGQGCILEFRVKLRSANKTATRGSSPSKKRRCVEEWYSAQVVVQNESDTTVLGDGSYTLFLKPCSSDQWRPTQVSWEPVGSPDEESFLKTEVLASELDLEAQSSISFQIKTDKLEVVVPSPKKSKKLQPSVAKPVETKGSGVLMYNFLYNGNTQQQTECRRNMVCPWCSLDCKVLYSLLEHITRCHPRFKVTFIPGLNGFDEIDVSVSELEILLPVPRPDEENRIPIFSGPNRRATLYSLQMLGSLTKTVRSTSDFVTLDISPYKRPHNRLYFHSNSYEPIKACEVDYDSDNEDVMRWMSSKTKQLIQDFTDVNEGEKAIMILWNCFILPIRPLADHMVPGLVLKFVQEHGPEIVSRGLINNFILHLTNLHCFGLLTASQLEEAALNIYAIQEEIPAKEQGSSKETATVAKETATVAKEEAAGPLEVPTSLVERDISRDTATLAGGKGS